MQDVKEFIRKFFANIFGHSLVIMLASAWAKVLQDYAIKVWWDCPIKVSPELKLENPLVIPCHFQTLN